MRIHLSKPNFPYYTILILFGIVCALLVLYFKLGHKKNLKFKQYLFFVYLYFLPILIFFIAFAYIFDNFFHFLNGEKFGSSGYSFLGGCVPLIFLFLILFINCKNKKKKELFDNTILTIPLIHAFGRIGCFFSGCCYGIQASWGISYWENSLAANQYGFDNYVLPTQLFESLFLFILFLSLLFIFKKNRLFYYSVFYGIYRFFIEFIRGDNRGTTKLFFSPSQLMSIFLIIIAIIYYLKVMKSQKEVLQNK